MFIEPCLPFLRHSPFVRTSISNCRFLVRYENTMVENTMVENTIIEEFNKLIYNIIRFYNKEYLDSLGNKAYVKTLRLNDIPYIIQYKFFN